ncbi:hypothetical protein K501DRAFT_277661 [Backusella circina FSU 941]|nr:hypothetical protein K501DRAFT_277661 [Backusella circina FSU 941]
MSLRNFLKAGLFFITGFYLGYQYCKSITRYSQRQRVNQNYSSENDNDELHDTLLYLSSSGSNSESKHSKVTTPDTESVQDTNSVANIEMERDNSDISELSLHQHLTRFNATLNRLGKDQQSTELSSSDNDPASSFSGSSEGTATTPIIVQDSDESTVPESGVLVNHRSVFLRGGSIINQYSDNNSSNSSKSSSDSTSKSDDSDETSSSDSSSDSNGGNKAIGPCELYKCFF